MNWEYFKQEIKTLLSDEKTGISQGVTDFISDGALGFDMIAASLIVAKKVFQL